jgi:glycosyltransferase involved in cell wall biosynthesis
LAHRVVHIVRNAQPECAAQARIVAALAAGLDRSRYNLHCCFVQSDGPLSAELESLGVPIHILGWDGKRYDLPAAFKLFAYLRRERFSIFHDHYGGVWGRRVARAAGVKANVLHLHTRVHENRSLHPTEMSPCAADAVIATSDAVAKYVRGIRAEVIYPGVEMETSASDVIKPGYVVGTAACLVPVKGLEYLLRAISLVRAEIPQVRLQIAGSGPLQSRLEFEVKELGLDGHVDFLGWQPSLKHWFSTWDIFALPSVEEAFGMAALEAMASGLPLVATNVGGIPELVVHGSTGWLVPPRDPPSMAARLTQLLRSQEERHRMGAAARERARSHFSCRRMVNSMTSLYDSLIQAKC